MVKTVLSLKLIQHSQSFKLDKNKRRVVRRLNFKDGLKQDLLPTNHYCICPLSPTSMPKESIIHNFHTTALIFTELPNT
ncbi:hypothetical protein KSS87_021300 [Heliosperma pusillum]|nr:hypothetical protein KSS87_021300 [Heliosperma pusillum]